MQGGVRRRVSDGECGGGSEQISGERANAQPNHHGNRQSD